MTNEWFKVFRNSWCNLADRFQFNGVIDYLLWRNFIEVTIYLFLVWFLFYFQEKKQFLTISLFVSGLELNFFFFCCSVILRRWRTLVQCCVTWDFHLRIYTCSEPSRDGGDGVCVYLRGFILPKRREWFNSVWWTLFSMSECDVLFLWHNFWGDLFCIWSIELFFPQWR